MAKSYEEIAKFQQVLLNSGFNPGVADGRWGGNTKGAMNAYQGAIGMMPTKFPDELTVATMNTEAPNRAAMGESPPIIISLKKLMSAINQQANEKPSGMTTTGEETIYPSEENGTPPLEEGWSMPWWGWGLIGLGVVGTIVGGVWAWKRYKKKHGKKGFGDPEEEGMTCTVGLSRQEKTFPKFVWGTPVKEEKKRKAKSRRRARTEIDIGDDGDIIDVEAEEVGEGE